MAGEGLDRIPLRVPPRWDPVWFETFVRDVLSLADVRNATEGLGISITGQSDDVATIAASEDVQELLESSLLTADASDLDNARQLVASDGSIELEDNGPGNTFEIEVAQYGITLDKITQIPALSLLATQDSSDPGTLEVVTSSADDTLLARVAGAIAFSQLTLGMVPDGLITFAKLQDADALSVLGRSSNTAGVLDEIAAGSDHQILRRSGTAIGFGSIDLSQSAAVGSSRLAFANIAQITGQAVLGVASAGAGNLAPISAGTNDRVLSQTAGALGFTQLTAGMFPSTVVPDAALSSNVALLNRNSQTFTARNNIVVADDLVGFGVFGATAGLRIRPWISSIARTRIEAFNAAESALTPLAVISQVFDLSTTNTGTNADITLNGVPASAFATTQSGNFTATLTGMTASTTGTVQWRRTGNKMTLYAASNVLGTSNATTMTMTGLAAACTPANTQTVMCYLISDGQGVLGMASVSGTTITFYAAISDNPNPVPLATSFFNASGSKGVPAGWSITYELT